MTIHEIILHLTLCEDVGPIFIQKLIALCGDELSAIYHWTVKDWRNNTGISDARAVQMRAHLSSDTMLSAELAHINRVHAQWMSVADQRYPVTLRAIHAPPPILYWFGSLQTLQQKQALAVIGSRAANTYGAEIIETCVPALVQAGFSIVSGGALGADSMAHRQTLKAGGKTVAVLGSGLLHLYPRTHIKLFEDIIAHDGTVVTSFAINVQALPSNFPARNRIIAGLSKGCLVIQAAEKSGTRITAQYALQEGREVFVVPGRFNDPLSAGCHALAREGATLVTSAAQICEELGVLSVKDAAAQQSVFVPAIKSEKESPVLAEKQQTSENISLADRILCVTKKPLSIDELAELLCLEHDVLQAQLWDLQWQGKVQQDFTGRWCVY